MHSTEWTDCVMPPKKKPPNVEAKKSGNVDRKRSKTKEKDVLADANPIKRSSRAVGRAGDIRRQRDVHAAQIEQEKADQEQEIRQLRDKIAFYKRDNEKILKQQTKKFGTTLDDLKYVKDDLDQAKFFNNSLYQELESRKEENDKLTLEKEHVLTLINDLKAETSELEREKKIYERELNEVYRKELKVQRLQTSNKAMRSILIKHKINPNADASRIGVKSTSPQTQYYLPAKGSGLPTIYTKDNILSARRECTKSLSRVNLRRSRSTQRDSDSPVSEMYLISSHRPYMLTHVKTVPTGR